MASLMAALAAKSSAQMHKPVAGKGDAETMVMGE
jgi:hypothetical protein